MSPRGPAYGSGPARRAAPPATDTGCDSLTAFVTTVCIKAEPLRAYIQPEVCETETEFDLYAVHYIHDYEKAGGSPIDYFKITLEDVLVTRVDVSGAQGAGSTALDVPSRQP